MTPAVCLASAIDPALAILPGSMRSDAARVMLLAIGLQESSLTTRRQFHGPAHGLWQFEKGGGVRGVLKNPRTMLAAAQLCQTCNVAATEAAVYEALLADDVLAAGFARLCLWADPQPLPAIGDVHGGWQCYLRNWRPGKPRPGDWGDNYDAAVAAARRQ